ncbi:MAG: hypothetical protein NC124_17880 [Clostridium sp.]|nr:hypothetical protein [Clostridium sp.]
MEKILKKSLDELNMFVPDKVGFICFASFETRCLSIPSVIDQNKIVKTWVLRNNYGRTAETNQSHFDIIKNISKNSKEIEFSLKRSDKIADLVYALMKELRELQIDKIVIDISTFTHEVLLILIKALYISKNNFKNVLFLYNGADKYSDWLSKGCKDIRNVVGYPGYWNPNYKYHLIVLSGFEQERITGLVEMLEPDSLSLGICSDSTNDNHKDYILQYRERFNDWAQNLQVLQKYEQFNFSCINIEETVKNIEKIINSNRDMNYILAPLNTKLSTVAAGIVALKNENIQLCYPIPEAYNIKYASPSSNVTIVDLLSLEGFKDKKL